VITKVINWTRQIIECKKRTDK